MSVLNGYASQPLSRQPLRAGQQQGQGQQQGEYQTAPPAWQHTAPAQGAANAHPQSQGQQPSYSGQQPGYGQPGYGQTGYGQPGYGQAQNSDPYAPQFEPYAPQQTQPASRTPAVMAQSYQQPQQQHSYPSHQQAPAQTYAPVAQPGAQYANDPRGFDVGSYMAPGANPEPAAVQPVQDRSMPTQFRPAQEYDPRMGDWNQPGHGSQDTMGFAQPSGGELDPNFGDEVHEDEEFDAPRGGKIVKMLMALAGAIIIGGGATYGYKAFVTNRGGGEPPVVKSASAPAKTKPADAGGKQFAHADSKMLGRLGDGASGGNAPSAEADANGTRKVATLVVDRDGRIQAPPAEVEPVAAPPPAEAAPAPETSAAAAPDPASVPGLTLVDALGAYKQPVAAAAAATQAAATVVTPPQKVVVSPPAAPVKIAKAVAATPVTGSVSPPNAAAAVSAAKPAAVKKVAVKKPAAAAQPSGDSVAGDGSAAATLTPSTSVAATGNGSNGFVAVLASVPRSQSSRLDALKRFADMQQKYGSVLGGKTPDVAEANLGTKGAYHRLVVGPPGSREQAGSLCSQLKAQGYADCWVAAY